MEESCGVTRVGGTPSPATQECAERQFAMNDLDLTTYKRSASLYGTLTWEAAWLRCWCRWRRSKVFDLSDEELLPR